MPVDRVGQLWMARRQIDEPFHECLIIRSWRQKYPGITEEAWMFRPLNDLANDGRETVHSEKQFAKVEAGHDTDNWILRRIA